MDKANMTLQMSQLGQHFVANLANELAFIRLCRLKELWRKGVREEKKSAVGKCELQNVSCKRASKGGVGIVQWWEQ